MKTKNVPGAHNWTTKPPFTLFSEKDGQMVCPGVVKLPCGDLLVCCPRDGDYSFVRTRMLRSGDGGQTWQVDDLHHDFLPVKSPVVLADGTVRVYGEAVNVKDSAYFAKVRGNGPELTCTQFCKAANDYKNSEEFAAKPEQYLYLYCDSDDGGRTFSAIKSASYELSEREKIEPARLICDSGGMQYLIIYRRELLEAAGWHQKEFYYAKLRGPFGGSQQACVNLADGAMLSFTSARICKERTDPKHVEYSLLANISRNHGLTWEPYSVVAPYAAGQFPYEGARHVECLPNFEHQYAEGNAVMLDDGRIYLVMRAGGGGRELLHTWSSDCGKTWTRVEPIDRRVVGVAPKLLKLAGGALALCHGRPGMYVMFDPSGTGENWQVDDRCDLADGEALTLCTNVRPFVNRMDCHRIVDHVNTRREELDWVKPEVLEAYYYSWENVDMCEVEPGRLFIVYDLQNWIETPGAAHRNAIRGVWLELARCKNGK